MKHLLLVFSAGILLAGCVHRSDYRGGTGTPSDVYYGTGSSVPVAPSSDLDDLGAATEHKNLTPEGQKAVPGRSVDINNHIP
jgi:hypothetical protein